LPETARGDTFGQDEAPPNAYDHRVVAAVAATARPAGASLGGNESIRPGVGIGKIEIGMRLDAVRRSLGKPRSVASRKRLGDGAEYVEYVWGLQPDWRVGVVGRPGKKRVVMVATALARERTRNGVGVGSTDRIVQRRLNAVCRKDSRPGDRAFQGMCFAVGKGGIQTVFALFGSCRLPPRTVIVCPTTKRVFTVSEVRIVTPYGLRVTGNLP
jgi:hypothetical protein